MRGLGKKGILFPMWGFQWGLLRGGFGGKGEGGWLFRHRVWVRVPGSCVGVFQRAKNESFSSRDGGGGSNGVMEKCGF